MEKIIKNKYFIITIVVMFFTFFCGEIFSKSSAQYVEEITNELIQSGEFEWIGKSLLNDGMLNSIEATKGKVWTYSELPFKGISQKAGQNMAYRFVKPDYSGDKDWDTHSKKLLKLYKEVYSKLEKSDNELLKCLNKKISGKSGMNDTNSNIALMTKIITNLIWNYAEEVKKSWEKGKCDDGGKNFNYGSENFSCSLVTYLPEDKKSSADIKDCNYGGMALFAGRKQGPDIYPIARKDGSTIVGYSLMEKISQSIDAVISNYTGSWGEITCVDKVEKKKEQPEEVQPYSETESASENEKTTVEIIDLKVDDNVNFRYNSVNGIEPSLIKALKYSSDSTKVPEMTLDEEKISFSNEIIQNVVEPVIDLVLDYGKYIVYAALLFFGVRAIFNGARGRTDFKAILPFLIVALIFFYSGRGIVNSIQEIYKESMQFSGNTTIDDNAYNEFISKIFGTVIYVVRILAFSGILFAGLKYMFANGRDKADIKKKLIAIVIGCVFVFSSTFVVNIVVNSFREAGIEDTSQENQ